MKRHRGGFNIETIGEGNKIIGVYKIILFIKNMDDMMHMP
jgi:hypothetical protein